MGENERYGWTIRENRASLLNDFSSHSADCFRYCGGSGWATCIVLRKGGEVSREGVFHCFLIISLFNSYLLN